MKKIFLFTLVFNFLLMAQSGSSGSTNAYNLGLAKTSTSINRGVKAIGYNPANIVLIENNAFELLTILPLPQMNVKGGSSFMTIDNFIYYFGGVDGKARYLTDQDKENFTSLFNRGGKVFMDFNTNILSAVYKPNNLFGAIGFSINDVAAVNAAIPQDMPKLLFNGNLLNTNYLFNDASLKTWWLRYYSLSYAREFELFNKKISAGLSLKKVDGFFYAGTERVNTKLFTNNNAEITGSADMLAYMAVSPDMNFQYDFDSVEIEQRKIGPFPETAGKGFGFDLGASVQLDKYWQVSAAITDIGSINWNTNAAQYTAKGEFTVNDVTDENQLDSLEEKIKGKGEYISGFSTSLPSTLRFGASFSISKEENILPGSMVVAIDFNQGLNDMPGNSKVGRLSLGIATKFNMLMLNTGLSFGGLEKFGWAFGLGFDFGLIELNFASSDFGSFLAPNNSKTVSFGMNSIWRF